MNQVILTGRLTRDIELKFGESGKAMAKFNIAISRGKDKDGNDLGADFPSIVCFGKTAELADKYLGKGKMVGVVGHIKTGSYEKDGARIYTTDVIADRLEFLGGGEKKDDAPEGFSKLEDSIPFR